MCPCGSDRLYVHCCQPFHLSSVIAPTAEALMRARYSAYAFNLDDYIRNTWHSDSRLNAADMDDKGIKWVELIVKKTWVGKQKNEAFVEFEARYKVNGKAEKMQEVSRFVCENKQWFYIDGEVV